ncbi:unnamed protein product [Echinostoma caproni]|uniref:Uncharacterized protein n=1 Tax=Echinostoma caproni TaxID=27848 RepID=A0A183B226_9TREM|nr:unnamed protein product [Echinostoma caproni]
MGPKVSEVHGPSSLRLAAGVADKTMAFYLQGNSFSSPTTADTPDPSNANTIQLAAISARLDRVEHYKFKAHSKIPPVPQPITW